MANDFKPIYHVCGLSDDISRRFDGGWYSVEAHPRSCFFCDHLTDIFWDYTNGPYLFITDDDCHHLDHQCEPCMDLLTILRDGCEDCIEEVLI